MTILIGAAAVVAAGFLALGIRDSNAGESCAGLDTALQNNLNFIAGQEAKPDALSKDRIINRQQVVDLIEQRRDTAGCTEKIVAEPQKDADDIVKDDENKDDAKREDRFKGVPKREFLDERDGRRGEVGEEGQVVCKGSTVTLSGEGGEPGASSNQFPIGTKLKVTNLDNGKSIVVEVVSPSGSCILLNDAAFEQVREPGKFLIRRAMIERLS